MEENQPNIDINDIKDYLSLAYGDNVETIFNKYVFVWDYNKEQVLNFIDYLDVKHIPIGLASKLPLTCGAVYGLDGRDIFNVPISLAVDIINNKDLVGKVVITKEQLFKLYSTCLKSKVTKSVTVRTFLINDNGDIEACKVQSTWYSVEQPALVLITSGSRYLGVFEDYSLVSFTKD